MNVILSLISPNGRFSLKILGPYEATSDYLAEFRCIDGSCCVGLNGGWFGPGQSASPADIVVDWGLPDNVCGFFVASQCYGLFRCRRRRGTRPEPPSGPEAINRSQRTRLPGSAPQNTSSIAGRWPDSLFRSKSGAVRTDLG